MDIYVDKDCLQYQIKRYCKALQCYEEYFGKDEVAIYSAPGRSELGGNHTDHQQGKVLAAAIHQDAIAVVKKTNDNIGGEL